MASFKKFLANARNPFRIRCSLNNLMRIVRLKDIHKGEQCVVMLTGPSLDLIDLRLIESHPFVLGANGAFVKRNNFKYYFCSSKNFYYPNQERIRKVQADLFFFSDAIEFEDSLDRVYICLNRGCPLHADRSGLLKTNLLKTIPWGPTVLLDIIIPSCLWMGFSEIILLGADYSLKDFKHFYFNREDKPVHGVKINHGQEMLSAHKSFDKLVELCAKSKSPRVKIYNCSPLSELKNLPKPALQDVLRSKMADTEEPHSAESLS